MQALSTALLAGLEGIGPQLVQHPAAVGAVLDRLAAAAAAAAAGEQPHQGTETGEEAEAAWALCSALAQALSQQQQDAAAVAPALAVLEQHASVLCHDFWSSSGSSRVLQHQTYTLQRLAPLLAQRPAGQALQAALERCQAAA